MTRLSLLAFALAAALAAVTPTPVDALSQLEMAVQRILREYGFREVDVTKLSPAQKAQIKFIGDRPGKEGSKRAQIRSTLGGSYSLRGLFLN